MDRHGRVQYHPDLDEQGTNMLDTKEWMRVQGEHAAELQKLRDTIESTNRASTYLKLMQDDESVVQWQAWCKWLRAQG